ncbi:MAG: hypothetical protein RJA98_183 [Pseudomonadota bacterium]
MRRETMRPMPELSFRTRAASALPTLSLSVEAVLLLTSVFWVAVVNRLFFNAALADRAWGDPSAWGFGAALAVALVALHFVLMAPFANRWTVKPLLGLLLLCTGFAAHFMQQFSVYLDPTMLRNVLHTDPGEAKELFSASMAWHLLGYAVLPLLLLWRTRIVLRPWKRALWIRLAAIVAAIVVALGALLAVSQPFSSMMRAHKEMRYLITPANYLWSLVSVVRSETQDAAKPRQAIGTDAAKGPSWSGPRAAKPSLLVVVVGETARAANWGLNPGARNTTPELAKLPVINFPTVKSCGTNTETSLPCMFAPVGRRDYDEARIRGSESLLHVLARAGVAVTWRDNQSGCKGVCEGLPQTSVATSNPPAGQCDGERCLDEGLLNGLADRLSTAQGAQVLVLHQLGNHGPSYFRRYPQAFERFTPACRNDDLRQCSTDEIKNAYDNALGYTDHVIAQLIAQLQAKSASVDSAVIYVSDHGESLGENNLFLHGLPYAIAPDLQTHVPMTMWFSEGFATDTGLDTACLKRRAAEPAAHDHLFHTVLGLMDVRTSVYEADWDLSRGCRAAGAAQ